MHPSQIIVCHPSPLIGQALARLLDNELTAGAHFAVTSINDVFLAFDEEPTLLILQDTSHQPLLHDKTLSLLQKHLVFTLVLTNTLEYDTSVDQRLIGHFAFLHETPKLEDTIKAIQSDPTKLYVSHRIHITAPSLNNAPPNTSEPRDINQTLVQYLLAGHDDEYIQTQMGISVKQLNREKTKLRKLFDKKNDFYIGKVLSKDN